MVTYLFLAFLFWHENPYLVYPFLVTNLCLVCPFLEIGHGQESLFLATSPCLVCPFLEIGHGQESLFLVTSLCLECPFL